MRAKLKVLLPLLLLIYIFADTYLKTKGIEICEATGCKLAGELLKFDSTYLNYLGMAGALGLAILGFLRGEFFNRVYIIIASAMVIFESLLIASQININPEPCTFCLGVFSFLLVILLNANIKVFGFTLPAVGAVFLAFSFLAIPKNKSLITKDGLYLISSKTCPHCKKTKEFLNKEEIKYYNIDSYDTNAYNFAKTLNIKKIPIAIEAKNGKFTITVGDKAIIEKFSKQKTKEEPQAKESIPEYNQPLQPKLNLSGDDEGCEFTYKDTTCESDENVTK